MSEINADKNSIRQNFIEQSISPLNESSLLEVDKKQNKYLAKLKEKQLLFNLKITDLTMIENPFVFYENLQVDDEGYLLFERSEEEEILRRREQANKPKPLPKASLFKSYNNLSFVIGSSKVDGELNDRDVEEDKRGT